MEQLDDLLADANVTLTDNILDRIDKIVPAGTDVGTPDQSAYLPDLPAPRPPPPTRESTRRLRTASPIPPSHHGRGHSADRAPETRVVPGQAVIWSGMRLTKPARKGRSTGIRGSGRISARTAFQGSLLLIRGPTAQARSRHR